jgi:glyceraldehyde 3-phosphate dehydrogenase
MIDLEVGFGINGLGRIGRLVLRKLLDQGDFTTPHRVKAINSLYPVETIAHLLRYDTIHGKYEAEISIENEKLNINGQVIIVTCEREPQRIPWRSLGVNIVIEATGKFNHREGASLHYSSGAEKVIVTAPGKNLDFTVVMGVNDQNYQPDRHHLISTASCTTNCVTPILDILDRSYGIVDGWISSIHAYTNDQNHLDNPHKDLRRARSCTQSIIPTTTGVGKALIDVLPHLSDSIRGISLRVPVNDVSLADMTLTMRRTPTIAEVKKVFMSSGIMNRYIAYTEEPLVSTDFIGNDKSAIIDGLSLECFGNQVKVLAWYDNEWGYACRVVDMALLVAGCIQNKVKVG